MYALGIPSPADIIGTSKTYWHFENASADWLFVPKSKKLCWRLKRIT
jgi:hypothetical protein